jgi:hypothetical protein
MYEVVLRVAFYGLNIPTLPEVYGRLYSQCLVHLDVSAASFGSTHALFYSVYRTARQMPFASDKDDRWRLCVYGFVTANQAQRFNVTIISSHIVGCSRACPIQGCLKASLTY